ncbi:homeobox-leucine zipper protein HOX11-like isoform X2 [Lotus japonicus]|uniref:homeobox-leucine zipper protein HOX11-like isoform X2 n=1 Tax=Lotus japonicus TaxID=34305 RepID=UPI002584DF19|nr:homeobox-leucine zipper protein HOX11-like isoform X2 [Lotus japonicus]
MLPSRQPPILISPNSLPLATCIFCLCPVRKKVIMELGLSLGDNSRPFSFMEEPREASNQSAGGTSRGFDMNMPAEDEAEEEAALSSSPNMFRRKGRRSDEDENRGRTRKRLRLSKEQFSFLEESFKDHNTLNPKQKIALGKQLHLHPRQIEVWFQNRRARTKLKKIELDCKYLKKCCDTLTEENTRLHKELQELRALKTSIDD